MDFVNKFTEEVNKVAKTVVKGTNTFVETTKLSFSVSELEDQLKDAYADIGKKMFLANSTGIELDADFNNEFNYIESLINEINQTKDKILDMKNKQKCLNCGSEIRTNDKFCRSCGSRVE